MSVCLLCRANQICAFAMILFGLTVMGCGAKQTPHPTGSVKGKVFAPSGEPLTEGEISFYASELGVGATVPVAADGAFSIPDNIRTGKYVVTVAPSPLPAVDPGSTTARSPNRGQLDATIPKIYRNERTTPLNDFEIKPGVNQFEIKLQHQAK